MSDNSAIEWTDATWNPVRGCTKVSPGCANCYAETFAERFRGVKGHPYEQGFDLRLVPEKLEEPLRWKKPKRVFVNSMSDLFQDGVPDAFIDQAFAVMALAPQHTFQVLTKRPERMRAYLSHPDRRALIAEQWWESVGDEVAFSTSPFDTWPIRNVWLGVSVENQHFADERIPLLLQTPAAVRFISAEPLLEAVNLAQFVFGECSDCGTAAAACDGLRRTHRACCPDCRHRRLDWVIVGGESGPGARPFHIKWARSIVDQCHAAGVAVFVKQLGSVPVNAILGPVNPVNLRTVGAIKDRKGGDLSEWPEDLRVREFPVEGR